jgi:quercetin dioxygenase-like cupin family protein
MSARLMIAVWTACFVTWAGGAEPAPTSTSLLKTSTTWNGAKIAYLRTQCPEVDAVVVSIPSNASTPVHLHPVNNYAYVLEGEVTVEEGDVVNGQVVAKKSATFKKGDAFAEVVNTWHKGTAGPYGVKILVWYATEAGSPVTIVYSPDYSIESRTEESARCPPAKD